MKRIKKQFWDLNLNSHTMCPPIEIRETWEKMVERRRKTWNNEKI